MGSTHSHMLERWLGADTVAELSAQMLHWYGPPIPLMGVPGRVYAHRGGDFSGKILAGSVASAADNFIDWSTRKAKGGLNETRSQLAMGFASLASLINNSKLGRRQDYSFSKAGPTGVQFSSSTLWRVGNHPPAGGAGSAAPGGRACDNTTVGAFPLNNAISGETAHVVSGEINLTTGPRSLLLYDRIFDVAKTMSSSATEAVTGVPTRYQSNTGGAVNSAEGNFLFVEVNSALSGAHNWTVCKYTNQAGTANQTLPSVVTPGATAIDRLDIALSNFFMPLASGDTGIQALTQMQCSGSITGGVNFVIGHPLAWLAAPTVGPVFEKDYINCTFSLARVFDSACMSFLWVGCSAGTTATTFNGKVTTVSG